MESEEEEITPSLRSPALSGSTRIRIIRWIPIWADRAVDFIPMDEVGKNRNSAHYSVSLF